MNFNDVVSNVEIYGLENAIRVSKFPMSTDVDKPTSDITKTVRLLAGAEPGSGHDQFLTGIVVQFDLTFSVKAWTEFQRYHFVDFISSQSTMHRIARFDMDKVYMPYTDSRIIDIIKEKVEAYNSNPTPERYLELLYSNPCGMRLTAGITTNYRQLKTMYFQRKDHRLPEWKAFCEWCETLPYFKEWFIEE